MLKLNQNVKYRNLPSEIKTHLSTPFNNREKFTIVIFILFFLDVTCLVPLLANEVRIFTFFAMPFIIVIHIWSLITLFIKLDRYKKKLAFIIYTGCSFAVVSYSAFIVTLKRTYYVFGFNWLIAGTAGLTYLLFTAKMIRYFLIEFPVFKKKKKSSPTWIGKLLTPAPVVGFIAGYFLFHSSEAVIETTMGFISLLTACTFSYMAVKFIHQFFFIKANQDIINQRLKQYPGKKARKRAARMQQQNER